MEYESIEQEVKAENLRKGEREEAAANREHEFKMARANKKGYQGDNVVGMVALTAALVGLASSVTAFNCGSHSGDISTLEAKASCQYEKGQSHAAGVQAGLDQCRSECKDVGE